MGRLALLQHLEFIGQLRREFKADAIGVKEINAFENVVVGDAQHFILFGLQAGFHVDQGLHVVHPKGDVVDPIGGVGRRQGTLVVAQIKKGDKGAILQAEKYVRVRAVFAGAGHNVTLDDVVERQAQNIFVKVPCGLGVNTAVGVVVQLLNRRGRG